MEYNGGMTRAEAESAAVKISGPFLLVVYGYSRTTFHNQSLSLILRKAGDSASRSSAFAFDFPFSLDEPPFLACCSFIST